MKVLAFGRNPDARIPIFLLTLLFAINGRWVFAADPQRTLVDLRSLNARRINTTGGAAAISEMQGQPVLTLSASGAAPATLSIQPDRPWDLSDASAVSLV